MLPLPSHRVTRRRPGPSLVLLLVVVVVAACGQATPSVSPSASATPVPVATPSSTPPASSSPSASPTIDPAADAIYDTVEAEVIAIRGLQPARPVARQVIDEAELRVMLTEQFDKDTPPQYIAANERLYKAFGLIPADSNLRELTLELLSGGVAGFYRDDEQKLYVVSKTGAPGASERFYFAHEYDHALQDQNFTVFKDQKDVLDQSDRILARQAVYEGDATLVMTQWAASALTQAELLELIAQGSDPEAEAMLARMPPILRETLLYPYTTGLLYVQQVHAAGGWEAVNDMLTKMPVSTEQILHPEKYADGEAPVPITLPADLATRLGTGWTVPLLDTFGELQMRIWLAAGDSIDPESTDAAAGWGGDRLAVMQGPSGAWAVVMHTIWDTEADAVEFEREAKLAMRDLADIHGIVPGAGGTHRWIVVASDDATFGLVQNVLGLAG